MAWHLDLLGLAPGDHPLRLYRPHLRASGILSAADLERRHDGEVVKVAGLGKTALAAALTQRYDAPVHFFSAGEGITSPARCLNHLCAQLIVRYDLPHTHLPERTGEDAGFFRQLLAEAATKQPDDGPLILLIDALDEAAPTSARHNSAHLPASLPEGMFIILTQRPGV